MFHLTPTLKKIIEDYKLILNQDEHDSFVKEVMSRLEFYLEHFFSFEPGSQRGREIQRLIDNEVTQVNHIKASCHKGCGSCCHLEVQITADDAAVLIESLMGLVAFWFLEVSSLVFVYMLLSYFLSGHMLPLDWLPAPINDWIQLLPFKYLAFVPAAVLLEKYNHQQLALELGLGFAWVIVLYLLNRLALARGLRRYSAYGG